ncbi:MAG TPA: DinB family protein [Candidatus Limnocylindria bacterium]
MTEPLTYDDDTAFRLADDAATVSAIVRRVPDERLRGERIGDWTAKEVIGHLADGAEIFAERVRRCLEEDRPALASYDQDALAAERHNNEADPMALSKRLQAAHARMIRLLERPGAAERVGIHEQHGEVTAGWLAAYEARHAHEHARELGALFPPA